MILYGHIPINGLRHPEESCQHRQTPTMKTSIIKRLGYLPRAIYPLDLEAFTMSELRERDRSEAVRATHHYEFHALVCVTQGTCTQVIDFEPVRCAPGSLLTIRPGQAHSYGRTEDWDGWNVLFRPEFVLPVSGATRSLKLAVDLQRLPEHIALGSKQLRTVTRLIEQMHADAQLEAPFDDVNALLRHQLHALLTRLSILQGSQQAQEQAMSPALQRFQRFQQLVEERFSQWHQVADYANRLAYTEKSLARAVTATAGTTAKAFITARIVLEAKRLLVHTDLPVANIAEQLGFDEATNFGKFFRREVGSTPAEFRRRQAAAP
jgi:AraC-like DNA-binding protein